MADQQQVNPEDPEVIRRRMEETRASLAEKIEVLEQRVTNTVEEATSAVSETVHEAKEAVHETVTTVKETVSNTVEKVREAFDLSAHVRNHPWPMFGGSVAVGFLGGLLLGPSQRRPPAPSEPIGAEFAPEFVAEPEYEAASGWTGAAAQAQREQHSWWNWLNSTFGSEIEKLKGLAIGTMAGVVRDLVGQALPENLKPMVTDMINNVTTKLGGETIKGRIVPEPSSDEETSSTEHASFHSL